MIYVVALAGKHFEITKINKFKKELMEKWMKGRESQVELQST